MCEGAESDEAGATFTGLRHVDICEQAVLTTDGMALVDLAKDAEDVASALHTLRDNLPTAAKKITSAISELFALSTELRELDDAQSDPQLSPAFYRVQEDVGHVVRSMSRSLRDVLDMIARSRSMPIQMVWDDLRHKMEQDEDAGLVERLRWYRGLLRAQLDILNGYQPSDLRELRRAIRALWGSQQASALTAPTPARRPSQMSSPSTPRPGPSRRPSTSRRPSARTPTPISPRPIRPPIPRMDTPISPVTSSDDWDGNHPRAGNPPPVAPDAPNILPQSPTFSSSSSNTLNSSQTSYSSHNFMAIAPPLVHWAQDVFDGSMPRTRFDQAYQDQEPSVCHGIHDPDAVNNLAMDGFELAIQQLFDKDDVLVRLYFRPSDSRSRIFMVTKSSSGRELHHCIPLTSLKVIRRQSTLQFCRLRKAGKYVQWARLNFVSYERMVLFYCTFVAMKRQDRREIEHDELLDEFELEQPHGEAEVVQFGGVIQDGSLCHGLRVYQDQGSGAVRLEASALRGPMKDVPLWTAFVTRYATDPDWAHLESSSTVSLAALKPPPYVFLAGYHPPRRGREYLLQFDTPRGMFPHMILLRD